MFNCQSVTSETSGSIVRFPPGAAHASKVSTHMIAHQTEVLFVSTGAFISIGCGGAFVTSTNQSRHSAYAVVSLDRGVVRSPRSGEFIMFLDPLSKPQIFMIDDMKWLFDFSPLPIVLFWCFAIRAGMYHVQSMILKGYFTGLITGLH